MEPQSAYRRKLYDSTRTRHLAQLSCHCPGTELPPETGHALGTPGCESKVTPGNYPSRSRRNPGQGTSNADLLSALAKVATSKEQQALYRQAARWARDSARLPR